MSEKTEVWLDALEIGLPLFTRATFPTLKACCDDVASGRDLSKTVGGKSAEWVRFAAAAALRAGKVADDALMSDVADLLSYPFDGLDDFSLATLAQVMFERAMNSDGDDPTCHKELMKRNAQALHQVLVSKVGSPLIYYEWVAEDMADNPNVNEEIDEIEILKLGLAHTVRYGSAKEIMRMLRQIGAIHLECDEVDEGCRIFAELIASDPLDFENYHTLAVNLGNLRRNTLSKAVAGRGLDMLSATGTQYPGQDDLAFLVSSARRQTERPMQSKIDSAAEAPLRSALKQGFMSGTYLPIADLARRIVPDLDSIPVKQMPLACDAA